MKHSSVFVALLALSASLAAQTTTSYKFKKPIAQLPVQSASGGGSGSGGGSNPPPVLVGELDVSTNSLNFGSVEVGNTDSLSFLVGNLGPASLFLNPVSYVGAAYTVNSLCSSSLGVSQDCQVSVNFTPTARGSFNGSATVTSSQGSETVSFSGQGVQASGSLQAATSTDFGSVEIGQFADRSFIYSNTGDAPSRNTYVSAVTAPLSLIANGCGTISSPVTLNPGENCTVSVRYQPSSSSPLATNLAVVSSADNSPISLSLVGVSVVPTVGIVETAGVRRYTDGSAAPNCNEYIRPTSVGKTYSGAAGSGVYLLDPDGPGGSSAFNAYCDMTTIAAPDGLAGGWTLVATIARSTTRLTTNGQIGSMPTLEQLSGTTNHKFSDSVIVALGGKLGRMEAVFNGVPTNMYWYYPDLNNNPWTTSFNYYTGPGPGYPKCWTPQNTWGTGRYFHLGDCRNSTVLGTAGGVLTANASGAAFSQDTSRVSGGYIWIR